MISQRFWNAHPHLAWAMWGLDEIEATLASFESSFHKSHNIREKRASAVADMRTARDAFRKSIEEKAVGERGQFREGDVAAWKAELERQWATFEDSLQAYLETMGNQVTEQETVFRARADAQSKVWQQGIAKLHESTLSLAANRRGDIKAAIRRLESEAAASKAKLEKLNRTEGASWSAMKAALTETRVALDRAHAAVLDLFETLAENPTTVSVANFSTLLDKDQGSSP